MEKFCHIKLFDLQLNGEMLLNDFSLSFVSLKSVCLLGESGSGKSVLLRALAKNPSLFQTNGKISFYFLESLDARDWKTEINFQNFDLETKEYLEKFLKSPFASQRYALIRKVLEQPDFLLCESLSSILSLKELSFFLEFLKKRGISLFYVTNQIEETPMFDYLQVIKSEKIAIEGPMLSVLQEEKLMKRLGFSLPFYVNMSIQLQYYGVVDKICLSKEELEEKIWKSN